MKKRKFESIMSSGSKSTDNFIYYDASITNTSSTETKEARFSSIGSELVLTNPSEYAVSVIRFTIPTDNIPLLDPLSVVLDGNFTSGSPTVTTLTSRIASVNPQNVGSGWLIEAGGIVSPGTTVTSLDVGIDGSVTMTMSAPAIATQVQSEFTASGYIVSMRHVSSETTTSIPFYTNSDSPSYGEHIDNLNQALERCFAELKAVQAIPGAIDAPFLVLSTDSSKLNLYGQQDIWCNNATTLSDDCILLFVNTALYNLLRGLPAKAVGGVGYPPYCNYTLSIMDESSNFHGISSHLSTYPMITPTGELTRVDTVSGSPTIVLQTIETSYSFWVGQSVTGANIPAGTTITALVDYTTFTMSNNATATSETSYIRWFSAPYQAYTVSQTSTSLPLWSPVQRLVFTTSMPVSTQITQKLAIETSLLSSTLATEYRPVLIDFEPIYGIDDFTPYQYFPQGPWRFNDLIGSTDLRTIALQVYWIDKRGKYNLVLIPPNDKCTILLAFVKKPFIQF